jgi:hypothetical protein
MRLMNILVFIQTLLISASALASEHITEVEFDSTLDAIGSLYSAKAKESNETLLLIRKWNDSTMNPPIGRRAGMVVIPFFGRMARHPDLTRDGFVLSACQSVSQWYGGAPYRFAQNRESAVGQADFVAAAYCATEVFKILTPIPNEIESSSTIKRMCTDGFSSPAEVLLCERKIAAAISATRLIANLTGQPQPLLETADKTEVETTILDYPSVQCRLDTFVAGTLNLERPKCWFRSESM